jgi:hypothetical protein
MSISREIKNNFCQLIDMSNDGLDFDSWVTELLEWNAVRYISREIDEDVWRDTKQMIEEKINFVNTII